MVRFYTKYGPKKDKNNLGERDEALLLSVFGMAARIAA
jgi:hypothetical protein